MTQQASDDLPDFGSPQVLGPNFLLIPFQAFLQDIRLHPAVRGMSFYLMNHHYMPMSIWIKDIHTPILDGITELYVKDKDTFKNLCCIMSVGEGQTDFVDTLESAVTNFYHILFVERFFRVRKITPNYKAYSLFDLNKDLYGGVPLRDYIEKSKATGGKDYLIFLDDIIARENKKNENKDKE